MYERRLINKDISLELKDQCFLFSENYTIRYVNFNLYKNMWYTFGLKIAKNADIGTLRVSHNV